MALGEMKSGPTRRGIASASKTGPSKQGPELKCSIAEDENARNEQKWSLKSDRRKGQSRFKCSTQQREQPSRRFCFCNAQGGEHQLVGNCLNCGKIVCSQEGSGPCLYCGSDIAYQGSVHFPQPTRVDFDNRATLSEDGDNKKKVDRIEGGRDEGVMLLGTQDKRPEDSDLQRG